MEFEFYFIMSKIELENKMESEIIIILIGIVAKTVLTVQFVNMLEIFVIAG